MLIASFANVSCIPIYDEQGFTAVRGNYTFLPAHLGVVNKLIIYYNSEHKFAEFLSCNLFSEYHITWLV